MLGGRGAHDDSAKAADRGVAVSPVGPLGDREKSHSPPLSTFSTESPEVRGQLFAHSVLVHPSRSSIVTSTYKNACICVHVCMCMHIYMYIYICICMYECMNVCMYV